MDNLEYIDDYFTGTPSSEIEKEFEKKIHEDPIFAGDVSFYLSGRQAAKEQNEEMTIQRFRKIYSQYKVDNIAGKRPALLRKLWPYIAAAAMIAGLIFGLDTWLNSETPQQLAGKYIKEHFQTLGVTMSSKQDSLQIGLSLYAENKPEQALAQFESIVRNDTLAAEAEKYAGIVSLRLGNYDKALKYFEKLENYPGLQVNLGKLYHAITLMKRGQGGDQEKAKQLLRDVDQYNLDGKTQAREWLRKL